MTSAISLDAWKTEALLGILGIRDNLVKYKKKRFSLSEEKKIWLYGISRSDKHDKKVFSDTHGFKFSLIKTSLSRVQRYMPPTLR